jgi:hypothetical protein
VGVAILPPEVNSPRLYSGPGSGPMAAPGSGASNSYDSANSADEVSVAVAAQFNAHAPEYQSLSSQAAAINDEFVTGVDKLV